MPEQVVILFCSFDKICIYNCIYRLKKQAVCPVSDTWMQNNERDLSVLCNVHQTKPNQTESRVPITSKPQSERIFFKIKYSGSSEWSSVQVSCGAVLNSIIFPSTCISGFCKLPYGIEHPNNLPLAMPITAWQPYSYSITERLLPSIYRQVLGQEGKKPNNATFLFLCFCFLRST